MACPLTADQINNLRSLIDSCKNDPDILSANELGFFKNYIESLGGKISSKKSEEKKEHQIPDSEPEAESAESDVELDYEGVIEPDNDPPEVMPSIEKEVSEEDMDKSNEKKKEAIAFYGEGKYQDSIQLYSEAILLNPRSAVLYAKRGQCFLEMKKANACIRDCTKALEINPDNAAGYKFRGRAHRLLGNFVKAAEDLRMACRIDYDEQTDEWLKEVTPNARKLEEHQRKYERKRLEKELEQAKKRIENMREGQKNKPQENTTETSDLIEIEDIVNLFSDQEIRKYILDSKVQSALEEMSRNPGSNPPTLHSDPLVSHICNQYFRSLKGKLKFSKSAMEMLRFVNVMMNINMADGSTKTPTDGDHD